MNFFKHFGTVNYLGKDAINIMNYVLLKYKNIDNASLYFYYTVKDGQSPESVAYEVYGDADLHWVLLLLNHIVDPYFNWVLNKSQLSSFTSDKYENVNDIHHFIYKGRKLYPNQSFEIDGGFIDFNEIYDNWKNNIAIPQDVFIATNFDFEITENDKRREIKILNKDVISRFVDQFVELMAGRISNATI